MFIAELRPRVYRCRCDCGQVVQLYRSEWLTRVSCGCARGRSLVAMNKLKRKAPGESMAWHLFKTRRHQARRAGRVWPLTFDQFKVLTSSTCRYCGSPPLSSTHVEGSYGAYVYNGLDRVDNDRGYERDNVAPCCWICNAAKLQRTSHQFVAWLRQAAAHTSNFAVDPSLAARPVAHPLKGRTRSKPEPAP